MSELLAHPYSILLARLILGGVFLTSGLGKLSDRSGTISQVIAYDVLPKPLARIYGRFLPWAELVLAGSLLAGLWTRYAAVGLGLLLLSFAIAVGVNLARGRQMECGCFGRMTLKRLGWGTLGRIGFLLVAAAGVALWDDGFLSIDVFFSSRYRETSDWPPLSGFLPVLITATLSYLAYRLPANLISVLRDQRRLEAKLRGRMVVR